MSTLQVRAKVGKTGKRPATTKASGKKAGFSITVEDTSSSKAKVKSGKKKGRKKRFAGFDLRLLSHDSDEDDSDDNEFEDPLIRKAKKKVRTQRLMSRKEMEKRSSILGIDLPTIISPVRSKPKSKRKGRSKAKAKPTASLQSAHISVLGTDTLATKPTSSGFSLDSEATAKAKEKHLKAMTTLTVKKTHVRRISATLSDDESSSSSAWPESGGRRVADDIGDYSDSDSDEGLALGGDISLGIVVSPASQSKAKGVKVKMLKSKSESGYGSDPELGVSTGKGAKKSRGKGQKKPTRTRKFKAIKSQSKERFDRAQKQKSTIARKKAQFKMDSAKIKAETRRRREKHKPVVSVVMSDLSLLKNRYLEAAHVISSPKSKKGSAASSSTPKEEAPKERVKVKNIWELQLALKSDTAADKGRPGGRRFGRKLSRVSNPQCFNLNNEFILMFGYDGCGDIYVFDLVLNRWTLIGSYPRSFRPMKHCVTVFAERDYTTANDTFFGESSSGFPTTSTSAGSGGPFAKVKTLTPEQASELPVIKYHVVSFGGNTKHLLTCHLIPPTSLIASGGASDSSSSRRKWAIANWNDLSRNEELCLNFGRGSRASTMRVQPSDSARRLRRPVSVGGSALLVPSAAGLSAAATTESEIAASGSSTPKGRGTAIDSVEKPEWLLVVTGGYPCMNQVVAYKVQFGRSSTQLKVLHCDSKALPLSASWYWHGLCQVSTDTFVVFKDKQMHAITVTPMYAVPASDASAGSPAVSSSDGTGIKEELCNVKLTLKNITTQSPWKEDPSLRVDPYRDQSESVKRAAAFASPFTSAGKAKKASGSLSDIALKSVSHEKSVGIGDSEGTVADDEKDKGKGKVTPSSSRSSLSPISAHDSSGSIPWHDRKSSVVFDEILEMPSLYSFGSFSLFGHFGLPLLIVAGGFNEKKCTYSDEIVFYDYKSKKAVNDVGIVTGAQGELSVASPKAAGGSWDVDPGATASGRRRRLRLRPHGLCQLSVVLVRNLTSKPSSHSYFLHVIGGYNGERRRGGGRTELNSNVHLIYEVSLKALVFESIQSKFAMDESEIRKLREQNEYMSSLLSFHTTGREHVSSDLSTLPLLMPAAGAAVAKGTALGRALKSGSSVAVNKPVILLICIGDYSFDRAERNMFEGSGRGKFEMEMEGHVANDLRNWRALFQRIIAGGDEDADDSDNEDDDNQVSVKIIDNADELSLTRKRFVEKLKEFKAELLKSVDQTEDCVYDSALVFLRGMQTSDGRAFVTSDGLLTDFEWILDFIFRNSSAAPKSTTLSKATLRRVQRRKAAARKVRSGKTKSGRKGAAKKKKLPVAERKEAEVEESGRLKLAQMPKILMTECVRLQNGYLHHFVDDSEFEDGIAPIIRMSDASLALERVLVLPPPSAVSAELSGRRKAAALMKAGTWLPAMANVLWLECSLPLFDLYPRLRQSTSFVCDSLTKIHSHFPSQTFAEWLLKLKERICRKSAAQCLVQVKKDTMLLPFRFVAKL